MYIRFLAFLFFRANAVSLEPHVAHAAGGSAKVESVHINSSGGYESHAKHRTVPTREEPQPEQPQRSSLVRKEEKLIDDTEVSTHSTHRAEETSGEEKLHGHHSSAHPPHHVEVSPHAAHHADEDRLNAGHGKTKREETRKGTSQRDAMVEAFLDEEELSDNDQELLASLIQSAAAKKGPARRRRAVPCTWKGWGGWGECSSTCGYGTYVRYRGQNLAQYGGSACHGDYHEYGSCHPKECPIHCKWGEWTGLQPSTCPVTCGGGLMVTSRSKIASAAHGGTQCDDPDLYSLHVVCNSQPCPIDCQYNAWSGWTSCSLSCGVGMQQRSRDKLHQVYYGGKQCPGSHVESRQCNTHPCPIDCAVGNWREWGTCTEDCGGGQTTRIRPKLVPDQHGGEKCQHLEETMDCNEDACAPPMKAGGRRTAAVSRVAQLLLSLAAVWYAQIA